MNQVAPLPAFHIKKRSEPLPLGGTRKQDINKKKSIESKLFSMSNFEKTHSSLEGIKLKSILNI